MTMCESEVLETHIKYGIQKCHIEEPEVKTMEPRVEDYTDSTCVASTAGAGGLAMAP
ncbi:MAG: hypothetical protein WBA22_06870 [Candidatus Methanofastidiosia archaeon]